ncbi:MAG: hypothetical protein AAF846_22385 [Chloroflexota bacterium]
MSLQKLFILFVVFLIASTSIVSAQSKDTPRIQEFYTQIDSDNDIAFFDLFNMQQGTTIYVYAESYDIDPFIGICDIDCEIEVYESNDDINGLQNTNSAFKYTFEKSDDYTVFVRDCCDADEDGIVRIVLGLEAPDVVTGDVYPTGDPFVVPYRPTYINLAEIEYDEDDEQAQQFYGTVDSETQFVVYDVLDAEEGQTLYVYAESDDIDTAIGLCDLECEDFLAYNDDIGNGNLNSSFEYTIEDDGDYQIIIGDCCDEDATGDFRILIGYNQPDILTGEFLPNSAMIAQVYVPTRNNVAEDDIDRDLEVVNEDCDDLELGIRPELSGDEERFITANFVIHYTTEGDDATDLDYVMEVAEFVELIYDVQINELGWAPPPRDCGEGGDARYDFYLIDIIDGPSGIVGYADQNAILGDNPQTEIEEQWSSYGYMVIDNDYEEVGSPGVVMRATISHEFHHLVQFGYDVADEAFWLYEATASWIETITHEDQDATSYPSAVLNEPQLCIGSEEDRTGLRIYGEWLLIDSIAQDYGPNSIIQLWEKLIFEEGMEAFYEFIDDLGTTPEDILRRYAIRNLLLDYTLADEFLTTVDIEEVVDDFDTYDNGRDGVEEMAVQYVFIRDEDIYTFELDNDDLKMIVVGLNPDDDEVDIYDIGTEGTIDTTEYDYTYIIVMNTDLHDNSSDCDEEEWELEVRDGSDDRLDTPTDETFDVSNFVPAD